MVVFVRNDRPEDLCSRRRVERAIVVKHHVRAQGDLQAQSVVHPLPIRGEPGNGATVDRDLRQTLEREPLDDLARSCGLCPDARALREADRQGFLRRYRIRFGRATRLQQQRKKKNAATAPVGDAALIETPIERVGPARLLALLVGARPCFVGNPRAKILRFTNR